MAAKYGDAFYPVASYFAEPIDGGNIGVRQRAGLSRRQRSLSGLRGAGQRKAEHQGLAGLNDSERLLARRGRGAVGVAALVQSPSSA